MQTQRKKPPRRRSTNFLRSLKRQASRPLMLLYGDVPKPSVGLAMSGGGMRSALFGSGVLRYLLEERVRLDFLSSVGGGGFVAGSYMDWKYREGGLDSPGWHKRYFERIISGASEMMFRFEQGWCAGLADVVTGALMPLFNALVISPLVSFSLIFMLALSVDMATGGVLRHVYQIDTVNTERTLPLSTFHLVLPLVLLLTSIQLRFVRRRFHTAHVPSLVDHAVSTFLAVVIVVLAIVSQVCVIAACRIDIIDIDIIDFVKKHHVEASMTRIAAMYLGSQSIFIIISLLPLGKRAQIIAGKGVCVRLFR